MDYQDYELELKELFQGVHCVPGTFPPVYLLGSFLISYNKLGQLQVIDTGITEPEQTKWPQGFFSKLIGTVVSH